MASGSQPKGYSMLASNLPICLGLIFLEFQYKSRRSSEKVESQKDILKTDGKKKSCDAALASPVPST
jgi:hypothetical protein